jgi:GT2 family glycosyltransferase
MAELPRCAVIIPTYNGAHLLSTCLESLLSHPPSRCEMEVILVDDASEDGTVARFQGYDERMKVLARPRNGGFATACNEGAEAAAGADHLVFLNNDTIPLPAWLDELVAELESHPAAAAVGSKLLYLDGKIQHAGVAIGQDLWPHHIYAGLPGDHPAVEKPKRVVAATAASFLIRASAFRELEGFDTEYRNGYEDIDLCLRLGELGHEIRYCPRSVLYHLESVTRWADDSTLHVEHNSQLFAKRWHDRLAPDDFEHYLADGLIGAEYGAVFPMRLKISPLLATVEAGGGDEEALERMLARRTEQVFELEAREIRAALRHRRSEVALEAPPPVRSGAERTSLVRRGAFRALGEGAAGPRISLLMPLRNAAEDLRQTLPLVFDQELDAELELVAVDSGSSDATIEVLEEFDATVLAIPPEDFDHGLTRNLAAEHASGDILVFLNARTRPCGRDWLAPLVATLESDPSVAGACSRALPYPDADILTARDSAIDPSGSSERWVKRIADWPAYEAMPTEERRLLLNFHTVSAAIRAEVMRSTPFKTVRAIGEDLLWSREVIEDGMALVHEPASRVYHSHEYSLKDWFMRNVDDGIANQEIAGRSLSEGEADSLVRGMIASDLAFLRDELGLSGTELERWTIQAALRRAAQVAGQWVGVNHATMPAAVVETFSRVAAGRRANG